MAHIILTPYHPAEMEVASYLANKLKLDLEKRGHKIDIIPVPEELNLNGQAKKAIANGERKGIMELEKAALAFQEHLLATHPDAFLVSVHTGPVADHQLKKKPSKWKVRETWLYDEAYHHPDIWIAKDPHGKNPRLFYLEARAVTTLAPEQINNLSRALTYEDFHTSSRRFMYKHNLKRTLGTNIVNPKMIQRIGHLINATIRQAKGEYKRVFSGMYATKKKWTRKNKPTRQREQMWKKVRPHK